jgi:hypothetical protein
VIDVVRYKRSDFPRDLVAEHPRSNRPPSRSRSTASEGETSASSQAPNGVPSMSALIEVLSYLSVIMMGGGVVCGLVAFVMAVSS